MPVISVDPQAYASASQTFGEFLPEAITDLELSLNTALNDAAECAGHDPAGVAFAEFYDLAAGQTLQAIEDLRRSSVTVAALLQQSGFNHARSDAHSSVSGGVVLEDSHTYDPGFGQDVAPATVAGSGFFLAPVGWDILAPLIGAVWPDGDTSKLESVSAAWDAAASRLDGLWTWVNSGLSALADQESPELENARVVCLSLGDVATELATQARVIATAANEHAENINKAHEELIVEINIFLAETALIEAAAALGAGVTGGMSVIAAQAAEAALIARTVEKLAVILARVFEWASLTGGKIAWHAAESVGKGLESVLARVPKRSETALVSGSTKALDELAASIKDSPWTLGNFPRGYEIEARYGGNLPKSFPTIDAWDVATGVATSIKSIDLGKVTYQDMGKLERVVRGYIDKVSGFNGTQFDGVRIKPGQLNERQLLLVVPEGMTPEQQKILEKMAEYAQQKGVTWILKVEQ